MKNFRLILYVFFAFIISNISFAASFDCNKASTKTEKLICSENELSKLDENLASLYKEAAHIPGIKSEQRAWLSQVKKCSDAKCIRNSYSDRIDELSAQIVSFGRSLNPPPVQPSAPPSPPKSANAQEKIAITAYRSGNVGGAVSAYVKQADSGSIDTAMNILDANRFIYGQYDFNKANSYVYYEGKNFVALKIKTEEIYAVTTKNAWNNPEK